VEELEPAVSVVVTVLNEEGAVDELYRRISSSLDGVDWEVVVVDDGSTDGTWARLAALHEADPRWRLIRFKRNFGQHPAMHAGLARARGARIVTMDGDLQNEPEDIPKLLAALDRAEVASGRRVARTDSAGRTVPSRVINGLLRRFTGVPISDFGCAFNGYRRDAIEPLMGAIGRQKFTKALVVQSGVTVEEVDVSHAESQSGSRYSPFRLVRLALHVIAGFWPQPVQWIGVALGVLCSVAGTALLIYGVVYWIVEANFPGPLFGGAGIVLVLGVQGFVLALIGEYLARIQRNVEGRPLYTIEEEL
jgi:undecaprenyl-phosphate 4-deoxy-4-formamido-L-arabinose transferase